MGGIGLPSRHAHIHTHTHTHAYTHCHTHKHTHIHIHTHTHTHAHTCTHAHTHTLKHVIAVHFQLVHSRTISASPPLTQSYAHGYSHLYSYQASVESKYTAAQKDALDLSEPLYPAAALYTACK